MPEGENVRVLVVSDDTLVLEETRYGFPAHVETIAVTDSREALRAMEEEAPSLVIADIQTGSAGGFALARDMKEDSRLADVPVLMLLEREQDAWLAGQAGAASYRCKPIGVSELVEEALSLLIAAPA